MSKEFTGWTGAQFADLIQQVAAMKGTCQTLGIDMARLGEEIQSTIAGNHARVVIGKTDTSSKPPMPTIETFGDPRLKRLDDSLNQQERELKKIADELAQKQREQFRMEKLALREARQKKRDELALNLRKCNFSLPRAEQSLLESFVMGSRTEGQLSNLILGTMFRRDFDLHHLSNVAAAESMAEKWDDIDTKDLLKYLGKDAVGRQEMNAEMKRRYDPSAPATAPVANKGAMMDSIQAVLADAARAKAEKEEKERKAREAAEAAELLRQSKAREQRELEEIFLDEQRGALGAGEW